MTIKQQIKNNN